MLDAMLGRPCRLFAATLLLGSFAAVFAAAAPAAAAPDPAQKNAARELAREGDRLMNEGDCEAAIDRFERAYALVPAPTIALLEARCLRKLNRLVAASEKYEQIKRFPLGKYPSKAFKQAVRDAERELDRLRPRVPRLRIDVSGPGHDDAEVFLDGEPVPEALVGVEQPIDPGEHVVQARTVAGKAVRRSVQIEVGANQQIELVLPSPPPPVKLPPKRRDAPAAGSSPWGWVAIGVGGVGIIAGAGTGVAALGHQNTLDEVCSPRCPRSYEGELDSYRTLRTLSIIGFGVGAAGLALGTVILLSDDDSAKGEAVGLWLGPAEAGIRGSF